MKKRLLALLAAGILCLNLLGCGKEENHPATAAAARETAAPTQAAAPSETTPLPAQQTEAPPAETVPAAESPERSSVDTAFLAALEASVLDRMEASSNPFWDARVLVARELAYLDPFVGQTFEDPDLQLLAEKYLEGVYAQNTSNNLANRCDGQYEWQRGRILRIKALCDLYHMYGFLGDNVDFIATYVEQWDWEKYLYEGYTSIRSDIFGQMGSPDFHWSGDSELGVLTFTLQNNTPYTCDITFDVEYIDVNGQVFGTDYATEWDIKPGMVYTPATWPEDLSRIHTINVGIYFEDVR